MLTGCAQSEILPIQSHQHTNLDLITKDTLVVFDVDETLIQPVDTYLVNEHSARGKTFLKAFVASHPKFKDWDVLTSILLTQAKRPLIENVIPKISF